jgi:fructose-bisphosphate aldolase class I
LSPGDLITQGLDRLAERLRSYKEQGARFAKWREVYEVGRHLPSQHGIEALHRHHVVLELMILKPNMILPGKDCRRAQSDQVANATLRVIRRTVPAAVPSINFLSGGQEPEEATANLNAINQQRQGSP